MSSIFEESLIYARTVWPRGTKVCMVTYVGILVFLEVRHDPCPKGGSRAPPEKCLGPPMAAMTNGKEIVRDYR